MNGKKPFVRCYLLVAETGGVSIRDRNDVVLATGNTGTPDEVKCGFTQYDLKSPQEFVKATDAMDELREIVRSPDRQPRTLDVFSLSVRTQYKERTVAEFEEILKNWEEQMDGRVA